MPAHVGQAWKERFGLDIVNGVGSSESGHLFLTNLPDAVEYGTSGVPIDGMEIELRDDAGRDVEDDAIGEMWVNTGAVAAGYWNQLEKSRRTFVGDWLRTGDKYVRRPDGVYIYHGRTDDMFKVSGIWVSPFEVEDALTSHPRVLEAAVIPAEDDDGLIKPKAFVVLDGYEPGEDRELFEDLKVHVKRAIGPWKYPRWIEFVDELPKTASGKIQRYILAQCGVPTERRMRRRPTVWNATGERRRDARSACRLRRSDAMPGAGTADLDGLLRSLARNDGKQFRFTSFCIRIA